MVSIVNNDRVRPFVYVDIWGPQCQPLFHETKLIHAGAHMAIIKDNLA